MARLFTTGFETQLFSTTAALNGESDNSTSVGTGIDASGLGTPTFDTSNQRSGAACLACAAASTQFRIVPVFVLDRTYYFRTYFKLSTIPTGAQTIVRIVANAINILEVRITTGGNLQLFDSAAQIGSNSAAVSSGTWYRLETELMIPTAGGANGIAGAYLDGVQIARSTTASVNASVTGPQIQFGWVTATAPGATIYLDDACYNDNQGTDQAGLPGEGKLVLLKPVSDGTNGNSMERPQTTGSNTTNLWDAVDNTPPAGVVHSDVDANSSFYAFTIANSTAYMDWNLQTYADAGIRSQDRVVWVQSMIRAQVNSATGTNDVKWRCSTNPTDIGDATGDLETNNTNLAEPSWKSYRGDFLHNPAVTLTSNPVMRVGKITGTTRALQVDLVGLYVEYIPGVRPPPTVKLTSITRASVR